MVEATSRDEALRAASSAEVVAGSGRLFNRELVAAAPELRWVQAMSAGVEHFCPCLAGSEIVLTNARGAHPIPIAEHFLALLLALTRRLPEFLTLKARHEWRRLSLTEVRGMTLLILGLGNLGREITAAARGVGLRVVGYDPFIAIPAAAVDHLYPAGQLHAALGSADLVASAVPLTPATRGMLGAPEFAAMRKGAYFFNLSRGGVVDQAALVEGLTSGRLAGAGLDVFAEEPLPADSPLWDLPNVVITPHVAAESQFTRPRVEDVFVQNIERYLKGQPLLNRVDIARGF
jgi:phosphoglycerate dehydrogenase-like enzyme